VAITLEHRDDLSDRIGERVAVEVELPEVSVLCGVSLDSLRDLYRNRLTRHEQDVGMARREFHYSESDGAVQQLG
jgi:hypothetical protein